MGFRADSTVVFIMQVLARNTPPIPNCIPRTSLTHRVAHLAFDADDEPPLPPRPEPLPRQPKPNQVGPRRVFSTWAEYEAALAEYTRQRDDPARVEAARLYKRAQDRRRQQRKRRERPEPAADATRARQARRAAERARSQPNESLARGICSAPKVLALDRAALDASTTFNAGVLGGCDVCGGLGCGCEQRHVCTHCGALLFPAEAKRTAVRGAFNTTWDGGDLCCAHGTVKLSPVRRDAAIEAVWADPLKQRCLRRGAYSLDICM